MYQELCLVPGFREDRQTHSRGNGRLTRMQNLLAPEAKGVLQTDPAAILSVMHKVRMDNKIRYEDKASLSVPSSGGNHAGEHHIYIERDICISLSLYIYIKQNHHNQKEEAIL